MFENLVFSANEAVAVVVTEATPAATTEVPKTGVVSLGLFFGIGALATAAGATICKEKKEK